MKKNSRNVKVIIKTVSETFLKWLFNKNKFLIILWCYMISIAVITFIFVFWVIQIKNLQPFQESIKELQTQVKQLENETKSKQVLDKQQLNNELKNLKYLIDNLQEPSLKLKLIQVYKALQTKIDGLPETVTQKELIAFKKDLAALQKDQASSLNSIASSLIQALGGLFLFVTAFLSFRNLKATEDKQISERFSKAIEQLANKELLEARLGGIYSLEKIAKDSPKDHETVMKVLTAFIREKCPRQQEQQETILFKVLEDIQAALTVIGQRNTLNETEKLSLDLSYTFLPKVDLGEAKLNRVNFTGSNLRGAIFEKAKLRNAILKNVILDDADLTNAILVNADLEDASFDQTNLENTNLNDVKNTKPKQFNTARNLPQSLKKQK